MYISKRQAREYHTRQNDFKMTPELFPNVSRTGSEFPRVGHNDHRAVTCLSVNIWTRPSVACRAEYSLRDNAVDWFHTRNRSRETCPFLSLPPPVALHSVVCTSNWNLRAIWSMNGHSSDVSHVYWSPSTNTRWPSIWRGSRRRRHLSAVSSSWLSYLGGWTSVWHCHRDEEYLVREREWVCPRETEVKIGVWQGWRVLLVRLDVVISFDIVHLLDARRDRRGVHRDSAVVTPVEYQASLASASPEIEKRVRSDNASSPWHSPRSLLELSAEQTRATYSHAAY